MWREFIDSLKALASDEQKAEVTRFFSDGTSEVLGVSIGKVFPVAKRFAGMPLDEIETLLESPFYEVRMGAVAIMDFQARGKKIDADGLKALFELYIRRHDRIDNWDLVDRAAPHVVGRYLADQPRDILYRLARSGKTWERRTAIVATWYFIKAGDVTDTFAIADILAHDNHELINKAVGSWVRTAGERAPERLHDFLDRHAATLPRVTLRMATEKLPKDERDRYLAAAKA